MVRIDRLNADCSKRAASRAVPAQIACRILGSDTKPCPLDPVCRPADRHGMALFYGAFAGVFLFGFLGIFWLLRITRVSRVLGWVWAFLYPPVRIMAQSANQARHFWNDLTESL